MLIKPIAGVLKWLLKAAVFVFLFALALHNQATVTLHFFWGQQWTTPLIVLLLCVFALGLVIGLALARLAYWQKRSPEPLPAEASPAASANTASPQALPPHGI